jgi:hypothetical protein
LILIKNKLQSKISEIELLPLTKQALPVDLFNQIEEVMKRTIDWKIVKGKLFQITVGNNDQIWGVNRRGNIFYWNEGKNTFEAVKGRAIMVSVAADSTTMCLNSAGNVFRWTMNQWTMIKDTGKPKTAYIRVGSANEIWAHNGKDVFQWVNDDWKKRQIPVNIVPHIISAGCDGTVVLTSTEKVVFSWNKDNQSFEKMGDILLNSVSVGRY